MRKNFRNILIEMREKPIKFGLIWLLLFLTLLSLAGSVGLIKEDSIDNSRAKGDLITNAEVIPEMPQKILIDKIGVDVSINNPQSRNIDHLNESLKTGAVRYPGSGLAGEKRNLFLFGHSSNLPVVLNQNYKAFNDLEDLEPGDEIRVQSENTEFVYKVFNNRKADARDFRVDFETDRPILTLSTCNNFGDLDDRFVIQAELVGTRSLASNTN